MPLLNKEYQIFNIFKTVSAKVVVFLQKWSKLSEVIEKNRAILSSASFTISFRFMRSFSKNRHRKSTSLMTDA
jgi:hypothetical protein